MAVPQMEISVELLGAAVDKALEAHRARWEGNRTNWDRLEKASKEKWLADEGSRWNAVADAIKKKLRKGEVITKDDIPGARSYDNHQLYSTPHSFPEFDRKPSTVYTPPIDLTSLRAALSVITVPTVTPNGLRALGVTPNALRDAIRYMGRP